MRIILTHEQADFDALASLLGAYLLDEGALPVLPRRMNRNVRAFLTLYGGDLPFIDPRDLPADPVDEALIVDTQAPTSIKGMHPETCYRVIDHHPRRDNLPAAWQTTIEEVGANTTLLIEAMRDRNGPLNTIQATLLLLGIYEDTGSLTYSRTTPRDLRAAAFLMEQGASLQIAADFLNHPLSQSQQALYHQLRTNTEHFHIHGHTIVLALGDASETDEELSTLAHKLRDLLDPDALFVLVKIKGGVQLIARSTSDNIDVAAIAAKFGGGGHERAAASLIRGRSLDSVKAELVGRLPEIVHPAVTVSQIMSRGAQVLTADTPVEEAARRMRRYGYEGYPVVVPLAPVGEGPAGAEAPVKTSYRVIGLLTRRAVDRAISHDLHLTVGSLMEAGEVTIHPQDSIETLQRLMTDTGWGQIPVIQEDSGEIVGIVTRTDLLKTLTPHRRLPSQQNLAERLEAALPRDQMTLIKTVAQAAYSQHAALFIVGGFVRDLLLNRPSLDFDFVVEGDAIALGRSLADKFGGRTTCHSRFGTAKWHIGEAWSAIYPRLLANAGGGAYPALSSEHPPLEDVDLISARTEFYTHPTALPTVERGSIKLDLHRRDFTINTLALRLDGRHYGELHDYWGGLDDLRHGLVRVLHSLSFVDDPTRMLRAVRFEKRFDFRIEERTLELLKEAISLLDRVSGDRIRHELDHVLEEKRAPQTLARLDELDLLAAIHPALKWDAWLQSRLEALQNKEPDIDWGLGEVTRRNLAYTLWLLRLPPDEATQVCSRLRFPVELATTILAAGQLWRDLASFQDAAPSAIVARLEEVPSLARYAVYRATSDIHLRKLLQTYATRWQQISPSVNGDDLRALGLAPGPAYRLILGRLRQAWLDGEVNNPEEEKELLDELLEKETGKGLRNTG